LWHKLWQKSFISIDTYGQSYQTFFNVIMPLSP
jgi:hypothetical protein